MPGLPATVPERRRVQFQEIEYDGLVGSAFLGRFRHTFDLPGARIVLAPF